MILYYKLIVLLFEIILLNINLLNQLYFIQLNPIEPVYFLSQHLHMFLLFPVLLSQFVVILQLLFQLLFLRQQLLHIHIFIYSHNKYFSEVETVCRFLLIVVFIQSPFLRKLFLVALIGSLNIPSPGFYFCSNSILSAMH